MKKLISAALALIVAILTQALTCPEVEDGVEELVVVDWEDIAPQEIEVEPEPVTTEEQLAIVLSESDEIRLMKVAMAEAEGEGVEGKAMVMAVVYNRTQSEIFPDTIEEVLYQDHQFQTVKNGSYASAVPDKECMEALEAVKNGEYLYVEALFFDSCKNSWASRNREYLYTVGGHKFYR